MKNRTKEIRRTHGDLDRIKHELVQSMVDGKSEAEIAVHQTALADAVAAHRQVLADADEVECAFSGDQGTWESGDFVLVSVAGVTFDVMDPEMDSGFRIESYEFPIGERPTFHLKRGPARAKLGLAPGMFHENIVIGEKS